MNDFPLVSIVMPAFNAEEFIEASISSILTQTYAKWELLIVDDGSTDNTKTIVLKYVNSNKHIKYLWQPNGKQGKARNLALKRATGELVAFLDADDLWDQNYLEHQVKELKERGCDLIFGGCYIFKNKNNNNSRIYTHKPGFYKGQAGLKLFIEINRIPILAALVKKEALKKVNYFSEKFEIQNCEDYHLWLKLLNAGYFFYNNAALLVKYREHDKSVSANELKMLECEIESLKDIKFKDSEIEKFKARKVRIIHKTIFAYLVRNNITYQIPLYIQKFGEVCNSSWLFYILKFTNLINSKFFLFIARVLIR